MHSAVAASEELNLLASVEHVGAFVARELDKRYRDGGLAPGRCDGIE